MSNFDLLVKDGQDASQGRDVLRAVGGAKTLPEARAKAEALLAGEGGEIQIVTRGQDDRGRPTTKLVEVVEVEESAEDE